MEISINSWHYKILFDEQKAYLARNNTTLCKYFWSVVLAIICWIGLVAISTALIVGIGFAVASIGYVYYFLIADYFSLVSTFDVDSIRGSLIGNIMIMFLWSIWLFFRMAKSGYYKLKEIEIPESQNIVVEYVKAKKNKYCPTIKFTP